jgi:hypothetical protein
MENEQENYSTELNDDYVPYQNQVENSDRPGLVRELSPMNSVIGVIDVLRGIVRNPRNPSDIRKINKLINEDGVAMFTLMVTTGANEINTLSNYRNDLKLIYKFMTKLVMDMVYEFHYNRKKYGIQEESQASIIINLAVGLLLPSFFKALGAGDRSAATRAVQESIVSSIRSSEQEGRSLQRKGFFSRMLPHGG